MGETTGYTWWRRGEGGIGYQMGQMGHDKWAILRLTPSYASHTSLLVFRRGTS